MSRKPAKTHHASTRNPKRNSAPTAARPATSALADLQEQVGALTRELAEAREQQTATSEVLRVISSSPGELEPVFQAMLGNAVRICEAKFGIMFEYMAGAFRGLSWLGISSEFAEYVRHPRIWAPETGLGQVALTKRAAHITDARSGSFSS